MEDVRLWRLFGARSSGFYVDVGAGHPVVDSVTKLFYDAGWSGINIEPGPSYEHLVESRPRDVNLKIAIGQEGGQRELWVTEPDSTLSSFARPDGALLPGGTTVQRTTVDVMRLDDVLSRHAGPRRIDFLKIDAEGAEREVLGSLDLHETRPTVVVVEAISPLGNRPSHAAWESFLGETGYLLAAFDGINRFYVPTEHEDLVAALAYPISPLDRYESRAVAELRSVLGAMEGTLSWRVTRPLRFVRRLRLFEPRKRIAR